MTIEFDQSNSNTNHGSNVTSVQVTLTNVPAGALVVAVPSTYGYSSSITGVSSSVDGSLTQSATIEYSGAYEEWIGVYYFEDSAGGSMTLTVSCNTADWCDVIAMVFTGVATSGGDIGTAAEDSGSGTTMSSGAKTDFSVDDLAIGAFASDGGASTTLGSGTGWVSPEGVVGGSNASYQIVDATTETATCSNSNSSVWGAILAGFAAAAAADLSLSVSENIAVTENISTVLEALAALSINVSDSIGVSEFRSTSMPLGGISIFDGIGTSETIGESMPLAAITNIDNITVQEILNLLKDLVPSVFEGIGLTEFLQVLQNLGTISVSEDIGLSENIDAIMAGLPASVQDNIGVSEFITTALELLLSLQDDIGVVESIAVILDLLKSAVENIGVTENIAMGLEGLLGDISQQEIIAVIENISLELEGLLGAISQTEIVAVIENIQASMELGAIAATDNIAITEFITSSLEILTSVDDTIGISESLSVLLEILTSVSEQIALIENINVALEGILGAISKTEIIAITESISTQMEGTNISLVDSIGVLESITAIIPLSLTLTDLIAISEYILVNVSAGANLIETIALTEDIQVFFDNIVLTDNIDNITVGEWVSVIVSGIVGLITSEFTFAKPGATFTMSSPGETFTLQ